MDRGLGTYGPLHRRWNHNVSGGLVSRPEGIRAFGDLYRPRDIRIFGPSIHQRPNKNRLGPLRTPAGTSASGLIGGFLGGVFGRHLIGWLTKGRVAKFLRLPRVEPAGGICASEPEVADDPERDCREAEAPVEGRLQGPPLRGDTDPPGRLGTCATRSAIATSRSCSLSAAWRSTTRP